MQLKHSDKDFRSRCSINCALEILGDKWTLLIIRDALFLGHTSFNEFRHSGEGIASNILANRMEKLVRYGIMTKKQNPEKRSKLDYVLTDRGRELEPIIMAIGKWGSDHVKGSLGPKEALELLKEGKF